MLVQTGMTCTELCNYAGLCTREITSSGHVCFRGEGRVNSAALIFLYRLERFHHFSVLTIVLCSICCLDAATLLGRAPLRKTGRRSSSLDPNSVAILASSSAASLPMDPMCPATQVSEREVRLLMNRLCCLSSCSVPINCSIVSLICSMMY